VARAVAVAGLVLLALQLYPRPRLDNPPVTAEIHAPDDVRRIFRRACYDCHSHETDWPWYGRIAPVSWLVAGDVHEARDVLNFSTWESQDRLTRLYNEREIVRRTASGEMPPERYLWLHPSSRLDDADRDSLKRWAERR